MPSTIPFTQDALECIQRHLGKATADLYARRYSGKDQKAVMASVREILVEVIGERKAEEEVVILLKKHHLSV
jgi:hypothetical protein